MDVAGRDQLARRFIVAGEDGDRRRRLGQLSTGMT
jgi:hypothetical protein